MVGAQVRSSGLRVQGPCWSRSVAEVLEVLEMARVCRRGLVGFGICDIHRTFHGRPFLVGMEMEDVAHWLWITKPPSIQVLHDYTFLKAGEIIQHAKVLGAGDVV
jgi:hypothetical protein